MSAIIRGVLRLSLIVLFVNSVYFSACRMEDKLSIKLEKKFVLEGDGITNFYEPGNMAVDEEGNIYVADSGNQRVVKFNSQGEFINNFGREGQGPGEFQCPWQLEIYNNEIYVYDWNRNIQKFTLDGTYLSGFNLRGGIYLDMAADSNGYIYLGRLTTLKESFLVEKYDSEGNQILRFCKPLEPPKKPLALVYNNSKLCIDKNDNIYVAFRYINRIQKYNSAGKLIEEYERELTYSPLKPEHTPDDEKAFILDGVTGDIFCDRNNLLYVISNKIWNEHGHLIEILSEDCKILGQFYSGFLGEELPSYSELQRGQSIYIDKNQNLYVLDTGSMKVQVFKISMY